jgi:hypothetical protein
MVKVLCSKCDERYTCCDHCLHYDFNSDEQGRYTGDGWCKLHNRAMDPGDDCDDYNCGMVEKDENS